MRQVLYRAAYLLRHPLGAGIFLILAGGGYALTYLPLFQLPGYELSEALAVGCGLLGGIIGILAGRLERRLIQSADPRPRRAIRFDHPHAAVWAAVGAAWIIQLAAVLVPIIGSFVRTLRSTRCDPWVHVAFLPMLVLFSSLAAASVGVFAALLTRTTATAMLVYSVLLGVTLAVTAWPIYYGPQVYGFNHLLGYIPGPIYDEDLVFTSRVIWFRVETFALVVLITAICALFLNMKDGHLRRPHFRPGSLAACLIAGAAIAWIEAHAPEYGIRMSPTFLQEQLAGVRQSPHFRVFFHPGKTRLEADRLIRDLEFRYSQIRAYLGVAPAERITVFIYRSPDEKRQLVGAAGTQFAKPWRLELHVNDAPFPHPTLKHELAHLMTAPLGMGPFKVTSRFGVVPNIGVIEGAAVAADNPTPELTLHGWAGAMRREKLAPDVRRLFRLKHFYAAAAPRAYTSAGSFVRYLIDTYGKEKFQTLYARGDFQRTYQRSLDTLVSEWERFVDSLPLDAAALNQAFSRFREGSLFSKMCAREVAELRRQVSDLQADNPEEALRLLDRAHRAQPNEPSFDLMKARLLLRLDRAPQAAEILSRLEKEVAEQPALAAEVMMAQADLAHAQGKDAETRRYLEQILALKPGGVLERTAHIERAALQERSRQIIWSYLEPGSDLGHVLRLREVLLENPSDPYLNYLLGRRLSLAGEAALALRFLERAVFSSLPPAISREAWRMKVEADYLVGDCSAVKNDHGQAPSFDQAFKATVRDWSDRCDFERELYPSPLAPKPVFQ